MGKGFTLVELAIVLIIIGLLISGVLVAQSMINTAKIQKAVRLIAQCEVAISNFRNKYQQLPGDSNYFSNPGDNNGDVDYGERFDTWAHLSQAENFKTPLGADYQHIGWSGNARVPNVNCPDFDLPSLKGITGLRCLTMRNIVSWNLAPYILWETGDLGNAAGMDQALRPRDMFALDKKMDDGNGNTGAVASGWNNGLCKNGGGVYQNLGSDNFYCSGYSFMGAASGYPEYKY